MKDTNSKSFEDWQIDDQYTIKQKITQEIIAAFAELTQDSNPIHKGGMKKGRAALAQGALLSSFAATLVGNHIPGPGSVYMGQSFEYILPVFSNETIEVKGRIKEKDEENSRFVIEITGSNSLGETAFTGEMKIRFNKKKERPD